MDTNLINFGTRTQWGGAIFKLSYNVQLFVKLNNF